MYKKTCFFEKKHTENGGFTVFCVLNKYLAGEVS